MNTTSSEDLTELLRGWRSGDSNALARVVELSYPRLRRIARQCLRNERPGHTIQATALVHEAYLRLVDIHQMSWHDRAHFFAIAARLMRRILIDYARARRFAKRGGENARVDLTESLIVAPQSMPSVVRLDEALQALEKFDPRKAQVVEMRYFGGLTAEEIASVLNISQQSVNRDWSLAKAWLSREMSRGGI